MTWSFTENIFFYGKIGADNLLLMLVGILHLFLYALKRKEGLRRMREELFEGIFFLGYGFGHDIYRFKALRPLLLTNGNFLLSQTVILLVLLFPLYVQLLTDIRRLLLQRIERKP